MRFARQLVKYRGFQGTIDYNEDTKVFFGKLQNVEASWISYEAGTAEECHEEFMRCVNQHIRDKK